MESIETCATYIRAYDGQRVIVPNSVIYTGLLITVQGFETLR